MKQNSHKRTIQVALTSLRLNPGQIKTITLALNGKGSGLLRRLGKLPVTIRVTMTTATIKTARATLHLPKKPPHRHP